MMKTLRVILFSFIAWTSILFAEGPPLMIGIERFLPPFIMQGASNEFYGFDIELMNRLCQLISRTCQFKIMRFDELLNAVSSGNIDVAISAITITAERAKIVTFSLPYMLSDSRFLQKKQPHDKKFTLDLFNNKKIGVKAGSIFEDQIMSMGIKNPLIKKYEGVDDLLSALSDDSVDYIFLDNPTALYWAANSSGAMVTIGEAYLYGNGLGIAINSNDTALLNAINNALLTYQNSEEYKANYNRYFSQF